VGTSRAVRYSGCARSGGECLSEVDSALGHDGADESSGDD